MSIKIIGEKKKNVVSVIHLPSGRIARIVKWGDADISNYDGWLVHREDDNLKSVDPQEVVEGKVWSRVNEIAPIKNNPSNYLVEILPAGTKIEITVE